MNGISKKAKNYKNADTTLKMCNINVFLDVTFDK